MAAAPASRQGNAAQGADQVARSPDRGYTVRVGYDGVRPKQGGLMGAVERFRSALRELEVPEPMMAQIMAGLERISDNSDKPRQAAFFAEAIRRMDDLLDAETCHAVRDACACSKSGWRLKAVQKLAQEYAGRSLEEKVRALWDVTYMGKPVINPDGTITTGIGDRGGFPCPCPVFSAGGPTEPVSLTYCYCCAGHFRHHYQIALGVRLATKEVSSSALASQGQEPCRFVFEIVG